MPEENKENNTLTLKLELPQLVNDIASPIAKSVGQTLSHFWDGLTSGIELWYGKKMIEMNRNLELYKLELEKNMSNIPEENLQEPKMNIFGPAIDASKFYFEEKEYREMFAKLISSSCDKSFNNKIHPYFVEAIKQMKPLDAKLLKYFKDHISDDPAVFPIVNVILEKTDNSFTFISRQVFLTDLTMPLNFYSASLNNLVRLGLVEISYAETINDVNAYKIYNDSKTIQTIRSNTLKKKEDDKGKNTVEFQKGIIFITQLGLDFISICI